MGAEHANCWKPGAETGETTCARVFAGSPITWVRVRDFQLVSLRLVTAEILQHVGARGGGNQPAIGISGATVIKASDLYVPGELPSMYFSKKSVRLLVAAQNDGADALANELRARATELQPSLEYSLVDQVGRSSARRMSDVFDSSLNESFQRLRAVFSGKEPAARSADVTQMLLYLNRSTFLRDGGATADLVRAAMDAGVSMVLVQELNPELGACAFRCFFEVAPPDLLTQRRLFDTVAVPLYPGEAHRAVSIAYIARAMGAGQRRPRNAQAPTRSASTNADSDARMPSTTETDDRPLVQPASPTGRTSLSPMRLGRGRHILREFPGSESSGAPLRPPAHTHLGDLVRQMSGGPAAVQMAARKDPASAKEVMMDMDGVSSASV
jgi:hypothetical protein